MSQVWEAFELSVCELGGRGGPSPRVLWESLGCQVHLIFAPRGPNTGSTKSVCPFLTLLSGPL